MSPALLAGSYSNDLTGNASQYRVDGAWEQGQNMAHNNQAYNFTMMGGRRRRRSKTRKSGKPRKPGKSRKSRKPCGCKKISLW